MAKLSDKDWLEIKTRYELGHNVRKIAADYQCGKARKQCATLHQSIRAAIEQILIDENLIN